MSATIHRLPTARRAPRLLHRVRLAVELFGWLMLAAFIAAHWP